MFYSRPSSETNSELHLPLLCLLCCVNLSSTQALRDGLAAEGLAAKVIYSGGIDVDVLAQVGDRVIG
jgi:hypothetical protein